MSFKQWFPNFLTISRFLGLILATWLLFQGTAQGAYLSFFVYFLVAITDFFDGYLARKWDVISSFGKLLDPIADKTYLLTLYFSFVILDLISIWWVLPIAIREIGITILRMLLAKKQIVIAAEKSGKLKAVIQNVSLFFLFLLYLNIHFWNLEMAVINLGLGFLAYAFLILAVVLTLTSGIDFFRNNFESVSETLLKNRGKA